MPEDILFTCLIEEMTSDEAFLQVYWARASHMGAAIEKMLAAARENGLTNPLPREADPYDIENLDVEVCPDPSSEVFFGTTRYSFPPEPAFEFPTGIIPSYCEDEDADEADGIRSGYGLSKDDEGLIEIGVNVSGSNLMSIFERLLKLHDTYETFWYLIHDHWGNTSDQFYENSTLKSPDAIIEHLRAHSHDAVMNGFVTLTAYIKDGATNLNISDHKRIVILTYSDAVADLFERALQDAGFEHDQHQVSFDHRIHHRHFRPSESLDRVDLIEHLTSIGFKPWNPKSDDE